MDFSALVKKPDGNDKRMGLQAWCTLFMGVKVSLYDLIDILSYTIGKVITSQDFSLLKEVAYEEYHRESSSSNLLTEEDWKRQDLIQ